MTTSLNRPSGIGFRIVSCAKWAPAVVAALTVLILALSPSGALCGQTRDQCEACCRNAGYDEYYAEQCRLKCFRYPDHCSQSSQRRVPPPAAVPDEPEQEPPAPAPAPRPRPRASNFVWPNPLNLVPGKEWEAAAQILTVNGIPQQHPNFQAALRNIQDVLVNFARNNPSGGRLPVAQLERILLQFR